MSGPVTPGFALGVTAIVLVIFAVVWLGGKWWGR